MNRNKRELQRLIHPYFLTNIPLCLLFYITKFLTPLCTLIYENCDIGIQEYEMLLFVGSFIALRSKRHFSITDYVTHFCLFAKVINLLMFWRNNAVYAILYGILWLLHACFLQQPTYKGPDKVLYLRDVTFEQEIINGDSKCLWLVEFYTAWSPACIKLQPLFAELSEEYGSHLIKFAKVDIIRFPKLAAKYNIDITSFSGQLPTLILFRQGREIIRRPAIVGNPPKKVTVQKFIFLWENIVSAFLLKSENNTAATERNDKKES